MVNGQLVTVYKGTPNEYDAVFVVSLDNGKTIVKRGYDRISVSTSEVSIAEVKEQPQPLPTKEPKGQFWKDLAMSLITSLPSTLVQIFSKKSK